MASGTPFTAGEPRLTVIPNEDGTGTSSQYVTVESNVLKLVPRPNFAVDLQPWLTRARTIAADLAQRFTEHVPLTLVFPAPGLGLVGLSQDDIRGDDPALWVLGFVVLPGTYWYLTGLPSVANSDQAFAERIAEEALEVLGTGKLMARQAIAVNGLDTQNKELLHGRFRLRPLAPMERGDLIGSLRNDRGAAYLAPLRLDVVQPASHVLEMDCDAGRPNEIGLLPVPALLTALQLHDVTLSGPGSLVTYLLPEWLSFGRTSRTLPMPSMQNELCVLNQWQFENACSTAERLSSYRIDSPERSSELALHRFGLGCSRSDASDSLIDFVIALEALLLPYDREVRQADLSYRFRLHGALFIADHPHGRRSIFRMLSKLYDFRSRLVHGGDYPDPAETHAASRDARRLAARALLKAVDAGFPDIAFFNRLALGEANV